MNVVEILRSPLAETGRSGPFLRLVLAEAVRYGMPPQAIATLDDVAAILGFHEPLPKSVSSLVAGPLPIWRTHPDQPFIERVSEVEHLAYKQRCLVAFGGSAPGHMVGTAEIVCAMGNLHKDGSVPEAYRDVFEWAAVDVLSTLMGETKEEITKGRKYRVVITDDDVLRPGGRLHATYQEMATNLRRTAIAAMENAPDNPREYLRPLAQHFLRTHTRYLAQAEAQGSTEMAETIRNTITTIESMFDGLTIGEQITAEREAGA